MKKILIALALTYFFASMAQAQSELTPNLPLTRIQSLQVILTPAESVQQKPDRNLPANPIPVLPSLQDGPAPCPHGDGKSCALLGGRAYFSDPIHMTQHDPTFWKAATNPAMLVAYGLNLASTVADIEGTQACIHAHTCSEGNPLVGSHPSRARVYGTAIPLDLLAFAGFAVMKKNGKGNLAFALLSGLTVAHIYFASEGWATAHVAGSIGTNSATR